MPKSDATLTRSFYVDRRHLAGPALVLLAVALMGGGCGGGEMPAQAPAAVEVPPSLQVADDAPATVVRLDAAQLAQLGVRTERVEAAAMAFALLVPGEVLPAPEHFALVSAPIDGRVVTIQAHEGEAVRQGQVLLELESLEYAGLVADVLRARAELTYQEAQVERLVQMVERKIAARNTLEKAQADLSRARAEYSAAHARVAALGLSAETIESWSVESRTDPLLPIRAPIAGVIDRHDIDLGQSVSAYQQMMSLVNPAKVLVRGYVPPDDASFIQPGDSVLIEGVEAQERQLRATILSINPALGEENRSVVVNIHADTEALWPRPGQAVQVRIQGHSAGTALSVPMTALLYEGDQASVFVKVGDEGFEQRLIRLGRMTEDRAVVMEGVRAGDEVAVTQVFNLKALSRYEQYGEE